MGNTKDTKTVLKSATGKQGDTKDTKDTKGTKGTKRVVKDGKPPRKAATESTKDTKSIATATKVAKPAKVAEAPGAAKPAAKPRTRKTSQPPPQQPAPSSERGLRIVMVASEAAPFSKTGGLADVAAALPKALGRRGHDVTLITPRYRGVTGGEPRDALRVYVAEHWFDGQLLEVPLGPGARALLVDCPPLYDRPALYAEHNTDYPDNAARFAFLSIAASQWIAGLSAPPDVLHAHDWQAGLVPVYARQLPVVFTIHNLAYQGVFDKTWVPRLGLRWEDFTPAGFEYWDHLSFLKAGITFSDAITTVSPTYAEEIQRAEYGYGFEGLMRARRNALTGILNGIDVDEWNPATDPHLPAHFDAGDLSGKARVKRAVLELFGLPSDEAALARPLVGIVSRFADQKGFDLIAAIGSDLARLDAAVVVVGTGDPRYEDMWRALAAAAPDRIAAFIGFDEARAHLVEAGADMFLMPSRYEPCGLNQMYSLRYGTVPVVRAVGGLVDTVRPFDPSTGHGNGFLFSDYHPAALLDALQRAITSYRQRPDDWKRLQINGMREDFSWDRSAAEYVQVYNRVMAARR